MYLLLRRSRILTSWETVSLKERHYYWISYIGCFVRPYYEDVQWEMPLSSHVIFNWMYWSWILLEHPVVGHARTQEIPSYLWKFQVHSHVGSADIFPRLNRHKYSLHRPTIFICGIFLLLLLLLLLCFHLRLGLQRDLLSSEFLTKILNCSMRANCPAHLILHYVFVLILLGAEKRSYQSKSVTKSRILNQWIKLDLKIVLTCAVLTELFARTAYKGIKWSFQVSRTIKVRRIEST